MKITQEVRAYAAANGVQGETALQQGMQEKAIEFVRDGARLYREVWMTPIEVNEEAEQLKRLKKKADAKSKYRWYV